MGNENHSTADSVLALYYVAAHGIAGATEDDNYKLIALIVGATPEEVRSAHADLAHRGLLSKEGDAAGEEGGRRAP